MFKKSMIAACLIAFLAFNTAYASGPGGDKDFRKEIIQLLTTSTLSNSTHETIFVDFLVNKKGEIIVVGTNDTQNESTLRSALHLHRLKTKGYEVNKMYTLPIVLDKK